MDPWLIDSLSALAAIVVIDIVLAGDNAIVIALAARDVPAPLQKRAVIWGAAGAVVLRSAMTMAVVWLLRIPGLLALGGAMLVWIAYRLLAPAHGRTHAAGVRPASTIAGAVRTIVAADVVMALDNVVAVAGAAHGSFALVVAGLLISIPIVVWGSTLLLSLVERFPVVTYVGAGVLAMTAAKMIAAEPLLRPLLADREWTVSTLYVATVAGVLLAGFLGNHRRVESSIAARLADSRRQHAPGALLPGPSAGGNAMPKRILLPVDGSDNSLRAARQVIEQHRENPALEVHLLNVQLPFSQDVAHFSSRSDRHAYHAQAGQEAMQPVRQLLDAAGVPCAEHIEVGHRAEVIAETARRLQCDLIVMGTSRKSSFTRMVEDSATNRVLELATVPVELVVGDSVSKVERYGIPAGIGAALALLYMAAAE